MSGLLPHIKGHSQKWENFVYVELSRKYLGRKADFSLEGDDGHMDESESVDTCSNWKYFFF